MKESLQNIGDLVAEPSSAFIRLKSQPRSGVAFVVFYLFSVLIGWAVMPYTEAVLIQEKPKHVSRRLLCGCLAFYRMLSLPLKHRRFN